MAKICTLRQVMSTHKNIPMIDLPRVHSAYKEELDEAISTVVNSGSYIGLNFLFCQLLYFLMKDGKTEKK